MLDTTGLLTLFGSSLPEPIFRPARPEGAPSSDPTRATEYAAVRKISLALRVAAEKAPLRVARRSFGVANLLSSRLDWRFFSHNRGDPNSVNRPGAL